MSNRRIPIFTRSETTAVNSEDILYAESRLRLIILCTSLRQYRYYGRMDELMRLLGEPFYRCHVSWIINLDKVVSIKNNSVHMIDGKRILLGRNKFQAVRKIYIKHLLDHCEPEDNPE